MDLRGGGVEGGEAGGNFVRVIEAEALDFVWEVFFGEGCFSGTIGTSDEIGGGALMHGGFKPRIGEDEHRILGRGGQGAAWRGRLDGP